MLEVRGQQVLLDRDVAALYGVETRVIWLREEIAGGFWAMGSIGRALGAVWYDII